MFGLVAGLLLGAAVCFVIYLDLYFLKRCFRRVRFNLRRVFCGRRRG